jgi:hypothetical protein
VKEKPENCFQKMKSLSEQQREYELFFADIQHHKGVFCADWCFNWQKMRAASFNLSRQGLYILLFLSKSLTKQHCSKGLFPFE